MLAFSIKKNAMQPPFFTNTSTIRQGSFANLSVVVCAKMNKCEISRIESAKMFGGGGELHYNQQVTRILACAGRNF